MPHKFLAFDIETAKQFPGDFSDWQNHRPLGISCAATVAGDFGQSRVWHGIRDDGTPAAKMKPTELAELVNYLTEMSQQGYSIVTWNGLQFDFNVLAEESGLPEPCRAMATAHVDMMFQVVCQQGHLLSLEAAAKGMGVGGKVAGMSGLLAPELWSRGEFDKVLKYVQQDARCTLDVAESAERKGRLNWISRRGNVRDMLLQKGWLKVTEAAKLPLPDTSWMSNPISRESMMEWLN